jgi:hypothetical protein
MFININNNKNISLLHEVGVKASSKIKTTNKRAKRKSSSDTSGILHQQQKLPIMM